MKENKKEVTASQPWCPDEIDCTDPPFGQTCVVDECVLDSNQPLCKPLKVKEFDGPRTGYTKNEYIMISIIAVFVLWNLMQFFGVFNLCKKKEEESEDSSEETQEIFNTARNMKHAEVAIEALLWQIREFEVCSLILLTFESLT